MAEEAQQAEVMRVQILTPHVKEIALLPESRKLGYQPGQWVSLKIPVDGKPSVNRAYSMAEPEQPNGHLSLVFDHVPGGVGSEYLSSLRPGDRVSLSGPYGRFILPASEQRHLLLIGRYTGIVPIRCMLRSIDPGASFSAVTVIQSAPAEDELLYHDELTALGNARKDIDYLPIVSSHETEVDRVTDLLRPLTAQHRNVVPMICGIKEFARPLRAIFMEWGFERRDIKIETYN